MTILYRTLHTPEEIAPITDLEMLVWDMTGRDAIPSHIAQVIVKCGGNIIGAYDEAQQDGRLIGFTLALLAHDFVGNHGGLWLWSHMAAVHPDYQRRGIGIALKRAQRQWALENGLGRIGWTFDPLMAQNAHFNLRLLGATTRTYKRNHYGIMTDGLNAGFPSDRFIVEWDLNAPRTRQHLAGNVSALWVGLDELPFVLTQEGDAPRVTLPPTPDAPYYAVGLHGDMLALKRHQPDLAHTWQEALAEVFGVLLNQHAYRVVDFVRQGAHGFYILAR